ncbi:hypothetical protein ACHAXH_009043, partial [Discostella pseudostelligera]
SSSSSAAAAAAAAATSTAVVSSTPSAQQDTPTRGRARESQSSTGSGKEGGGFFAMAGRSLRSLSRSSRSSRSSTGTSGTTSLALDLASAAHNNNNRHSESSYANYTNGNSNSEVESKSNNNNNGMTVASMEKIITVTSCRSDAYYDQRSPGCTISKLPRRAPTALKTFHELAVGIKDAYDAGGYVPRKPPPRNGSGGTGGSGGKGVGEEEDDGIPSVIGGDSASSGSSNNSNEKENEENNAEVILEDLNKMNLPQLTDAEWSHQSILFEFMGNLDFLLAVVDEVAIDTATRGALKEDTTFRGLRDVIKKCNKVLESMLVRRERKYTLFFRMVGVHDTKYLTKIQQWNARVEKALGGVTQDFGEDGSSAASSWRNSKVEGDDVSEAGSEVSSMSSSSARSSVSAVLRRGRELLPSAGKVRARRATPTPRMRRHNRDGEGGGRGSIGSGDHNSAGEDGYSSDTVPMTTENLAKLQFALDAGRTISGGDSRVSTPSFSDLHGDKKKNRGDGAAFGIAEPSGLGQVKPMKPKDELLDVIRGLRSEQMRAREAVGGSAAESRNVLDEIKSNFTLKAEIPSAVPKLPIEYIHRHRLMKQVVNCLLDRNTGPKDTDDVSPFANNITCITSRHSDKAGNGKTTLAVAAIQTVEVREFFSDGIAWIHLGRTPLGEREVRRMYEQLYDQLLAGDEDEEENGIGGKDDDDDNTSNSSGGSSDDEKDAVNEDSAARKDPLEKRASSLGRNKLATSRRSFQGGELEGIKEDLGKLLLSRRVLICLDDVYKMEDAKWFLFGTNSGDDHNYEDTSHRVLITTRTPGLVGPGITHEVFVRIFSEHEAVKLLLTAAGRRPNGLPKVSPVFSQARIIVKGCGNSPLALRIAGGMLRSRNRNWTLSSPAWKLLVEQCRTSLEEASRIRSFANSVQRLVDLSFATVTNVDFRNVLRECFVAFAMVFHDTDSLKVGKGISRAVVIRLFAVVSSMEGGCLPSSINEEELSDYMDNATLILDTLETMNLVQRAGHGLSKSSTMNRLGNASDNDLANTNGSNHKCYSMHESIKAIAEDMAKRKTEAFAPVYDEFNSFISKADVVPVTSGRFFPYDECMVMMITGKVADMLKPIQNSLYERWNIEEYIAENMPLHLIRARMIEKAAEVLVDNEFCTRRVVALGPIEATRRHVSDLIELRRVHAHYKDSGLVDLSLNIVDAIQEGSACIIDEVIRQSQDPTKSVNVAICLSTMGEGLIKAKQPRDASQRLDEAASLYRELLGQGHIDVARAVNAVAKSLVKINETRAALIRFGEASSTYEDCNASHHFDSIANLQGMANLFVTSGDFQAATALYENVISRKKSVHGEFSVVTAKTINDYAVILAKNGRMDDALARYEQATATYKRALEGLPPSMSWLNHGESAAKCGFDMALINLNIASIKSKKGDIEDAINAYTIGVHGLRQYKQELELAGDEAGKNKNSSHMRHLVSALGRIGSLKLKLGDKNGALETYASLFKEVDNTESPMASRLEKAKAHIKCATIYRQSGDRDDNKHAIVHLREAYNMYNDLYGKNHKDTVAVATSLQQWEEEQRPRT